MDGLHSKPTSILGFFKTRVKHDRFRGSLMAAFGVVALSFDAIMLKLVDMGAWEVAFWRNTLIAFTLSVYLGVSGRLYEFRSLLSIGLKGVVIVILCGLTNSLIAFSISYTAVSTAIMILSTTPLFAAIFSHWLLHEPVDKSTCLAILAALTGVVIIFSNSLTGGLWLGNSFALLLAICTGLLLTMLRIHSTLHRIPPIILGALASALLLLPFSSPLPISTNSLFCLLLAGCLLKPAASILILRAPRFISAPEVSLFLLLEAFLVPIWAWLILSEQLNYNTLLGGIIMITSVLVHLIIKFKKGRSSQDCN